MKTISFVIPVYNEEQRLEKTFKALSRVQLPRGIKLEEVIFVNDGSTDRTLAMLKEFRQCHSEANGRRISKKYGKILPLRQAQGQDDIRIITYEQNRGKGYAVKQGLMAAKSDYALLFDADISTPLSELKKFMPYIQKGVDIVVGTRKNGESTVIKHQPRIRELLGQSFTLLTQIMLLLSISDFTCGFKLFSKRARQLIFSKATVNRWGYDAEILFIASKLKLSIVEQAVVWSNDEASKVKLYKAIPQTIFELLQIRIEHTVKPLVFLPIRTVRLALSALL